MIDAIRSHPQFLPLVAMETRRRLVVSMPGGAAELARNSAECFAAEQAILRGTGCTFNQLTSAVLPLVKE